MSTKSFARELRDTIRSLRDKDHIKDVPCDNLIAYLDQVINSPGDDLGDAEKERYKAELQQWVEEYKSQHTINMEMFRSVLVAGQNAIKTCLLINGGAAVALLAFMGHLWQKQLSPEIVSGLTNSLLSFMGGVLTTTVAAGTTYLTQNAYSLEWNKTGAVINFMSIILVIASYLFFGFGGYTAYLTFLEHLGE